MTTWTTHASHALLLLLGSATLSACADAVDDDPFGGSGDGGIFVDPGGSSDEGDESGESGGDDEGAAPEPGEAYDPDRCDLAAFDCPHRLDDLPPVMFVVDNSYSMRTRLGLWDHDGDDGDDDGWNDAAPDVAASPRITRWHSLHRALLAAMDSYAGVVDFGVALFPAVGDAGATCAVAGAPEVPLGADWKAAIVGGAIPGADDETPGGASPAAAGVEAAVAALEARGGLQPGAVVLITDGPANCGAGDGLDPRLAEVVADAAARGIPTHVIGLDIAADGVTQAIHGVPDEVDGVDLRASLGALAELGGTASGGAGFRDATDESRLRSVLFGVLHTVARRAETTCVIEVEEPLVAPLFLAGVRMTTTTEVVVADVEIAGDCGDATGWQFADESRMRVRVCGQACTLLNEGATPAFLIGCEEE